MNRLIKFIKGLIMPKTIAELNPKQTQVAKKKPAASKKKPMKKASKKG